MKRLVTVMMLLVLTGTAAMAQSDCPAPTGLSATTTDSTAAMSWTGNAYYYYLRYQPDGFSTWMEEDVFTNSVLLTNLAASTSYNVEVYSICYGDTSVAATYTFNTSCGAIRNIPYAEAFENGRHTCWTLVGDGWDDDAGANWELKTLAAQAHSGSKYMYSKAITYGTTPNCWMITPAIHVPADADGLMFTWFAKQFESGNKYRLMVSTTTNNPDDFMNAIVNITNEGGTWAEHSVSLDNYAGQTIYLGFYHYQSAFGGGLCIDDVKLYQVNEPTVEINGPRVVDINTYAIFSAQLVMGSADGIYYEWSTARADATLGANDSAQFCINYPSAGYDTLTLIVNNYFGTDTATFIVYARDLTPWEDFPYMTGFEEDDDINWTSAGGLHDFYVGTNVASTGTHSLYVSNDGGATSAYSVIDSYQDGTSYTYAYKAFRFSEPGDYTLSFDYEGHGGMGTTGIAFLTQNMGVFTGDVRPSASQYTLLEDDLDDEWDHTPWNHRDATFSIADTGVYYIGFCWLVEGLHGYTHALAIDNITIEKLGCSAVSHLELDHATIDSLVFTWVPTNGENSWLVSFDNGTPVTIYDTFYAVGGLDTASTHTISVSALCSDIDTSNAVTLSAQTACATISTLPFTEGFETYPINQLPPCWAKIGDASGRVRVEYGGVTGNALVFTPGGEADPFIAVLPETDTNISELQIIISSRPQDNSSGRFQIGYVTDPTDASTFQMCKQLSVSDFRNAAGNIEYRQSRSFFTGAPAGARMALRQDPWGSGKWWRVDNIEIAIADPSAPDPGIDTTSPGPGPGPQPRVDSCIAPSNLRVLSTTTTTATIAWTVGGNEQQWELDFDGWTRTITTNPHTLDNLTPGSSHRVSLRAICSDGNYSEWTDEVTFRTQDNSGIDAVDGVHFGLYPNPATQSVTLSSDEAAVLTIIDQNGRVCTSQNIVAGETTIDLDNYATGVYYVRLTTERGTATQKLLVK